MSVCMTSNHIYQAFYDDYKTLKAFLHSHSYTGNPLASAAALATLEIFKTDTVIDNNRLLIGCLAKAITPLKDHPFIGDVRQTGMVVAIEMVANKQSKVPFPWQERRGLQVFQYALSQGLLLRPIGNVVYFMPPYIISPAQIEWMVKITIEAIERATHTPVGNSDAPLDYYQAPA